MKDGRNTTFLAMMKRYGGKPTAMKSKKDYSRKKLKKGSLLSHQD